jgi:hypothetical protein
LAESLIGDSKIEVVNLLFLSSGLIVVFGEINLVLALA